MVHRLQNRNATYTESIKNTLETNHATLNATEGATALDINKNIQQQPEQKEINIPIKEQLIKEHENNEPTFDNISMENAAYLQNVEDTSINNNSTNDENLSSFEVDSIELATPELFSDVSDQNYFNQDNNEKTPQIFDSTKPEEDVTEKEPEMFEESNQEEDFEIPAFLRRQKN